MSHPSVRRVSDHQLVAATLGIAIGLACGVPRVAAAQASADVALSRPYVASTFIHADTARDGIVAEIVRRPDSPSAETYAAELVDAEGLRSWGPQDPVASAPSARPRWRARHAADGREVVVYYAQDRPTVCRIRRSRGGLSKTHQAAVRWCAESLGAMPPAVPPRPVAG